MRSRPPPAQRSPRSPRRPPGTGSAPAPTPLPADPKVALAALHLDLDEDELEVVVVDDVVLDAGRPGVADARVQLAMARHAVGLDEQQPARGHRHHDIVVLVPMPAGRRARGEPPLGDADALVVDLNGWRGGWATGAHGRGSVLADGTEASGAGSAINADGSYRVSGWSALGCREAR